MSLGFASGCSLFVPLDGLSGSEPTTESGAESGRALGEDAASGVDSAGGDGGDGGHKEARIYVFGGSPDGLTLPSGTPAFYANIDADGTLGAWQTSSLVPRSTIWAPVARGPGLVVLAGGVAQGTGGHGRLFIAPTAGEVVGSFWQSTEEVLGGPRTLSAALFRGGRLYVFGGVGVDETTSVSSVMTGEVGASSAGTFTVTTPLPEPRARMALANWNETAYVVGGSGAEVKEASILSVRFESDGGVASYKRETSLPSARHYLGAIVHGQALLAIGGEAQEDIPDVVVYAIGADGTLGAARETLPLPEKRSRAGVVSYRSWAYVVGGRNGSKTAREVFVGDLAPDGTLTRWRSTTPLPSPRVFHATVVVE